MKKLTFLLILCFILNGCCTESVVYPSVIVEPQSYISSNDVKMVSTPQSPCCSQQRQTVVYTQPVVIQPRSVTYVDPTPFVTLATTALALAPLFIHHRHGGHHPPPPPHW